jgi:hypothetical protein
MSLVQAECLPDENDVRYYYSTSIRRRIFRSLPRPRYVKVCTIDISSS